MSERMNERERGFSRFDRMSTAELKELLRLDSLLPEDGDSDPEAIVYIAKVVAEREKEENGIDVDAAWKSFNENYRPCAEDATALFDFGDGETDADLPAKAARRHRRYARLGLIAAIIAALLLAGTVTAAALGYDLWNVVARWTSETFGFEAVPAEAVQVPEQLRELQAELEAHGITRGVLPTYIPEGYEVVECKCSESKTCTSICCSIKKLDKCIILQYKIYTPALFTIQFEKCGGPPESYTHNNTEFYIMTNHGYYLAAWVSNNIECCISGVDSYTELINIINSLDC